MFDSKYSNIQCAEIRLWFDNYQEHVALENTSPEDADQVTSFDSFVAIERSCSTIDRGIQDIESTLNKAIANVDKLANLTSSCRFYANAAHISMKNISASNQKKDSNEGLTFRTVEIAHAISNWFFGLLGL